MSYGDVQERPAKKRRFFVEDTSTIDSKSGEQASLVDEAGALPLRDQVEDVTVPIESTENQEKKTTQNSFDPDLLKAVIGTEVSNDCIKKLQRLCGLDVQRGSYIHQRGDIVLICDKSNKHVLRWYLESARRTCSLDTAK